MKFIWTRGSQRYVYRLKHLLCRYDDAAGDIVDVAMIVASLMLYIVTVFKMNACTASAFRGYISE